MPIIDVRIGDYHYRLASGEWSDRYGIPPLRRVWRSLFADRQDVSGEPGIQNLLPDDLRWALTRFDGGEGQAILKRGDALGERSFDRSEGIDFSNPGQMVLGKSLTQQGVSGAAPTVIEGSAMVDAIGVSTVTGTDRSLSAVGDEIKTADFVPVAGTYQAEWFAYISGPAIIEGIADFPNSNWNPKPNVRLSPTDSTNILLSSPGRTEITSIRKNIAVDHETEATFLIKGVRKDPDSELPEWVTVDLVVRNGENTIALAVKTGVRLDSENGDFDGYVRVPVSFTPPGGDDNDVRYRIRLVSASGGVKELDFDRIEQRPLEPKTLHWRVRDETAGVDVISGDVDLNHIEASQQIAAASWVADGAKAYSLRVRRDAGETRGMRVDKVLYTGVSLKQPWNLDLGASGRQWLADWSSAVPPSLFYWEAATSEWEPVGDIGAAVGKPVAMAGDAVYEFVLLDTKIVYRTKLPVGAITAWTDSIPDAAGPQPRTPVGLTVAADRIWVLCMDAVNGVELLEAPVTGAAPVAWTVIPISLQAVAADQELPRQMAPGNEGPIWFVNHGSRCQISLYNAGDAAVENVVSIGGGFQGRAIVHTGGTSIVGGSFSAVDSSSTVRHRPALWIIEHEFFSAEPLAVKLWRDEDIDTRIQSMQLYGSDLYVLTQVRTAANKKFRLWRVSLADPGGAFVEHEIETNESQQAFDARALAVNLQTRIVAWGTGNPYVEQDDYRLDGVFLASRFDWGLLEEKVLTAVDIDGEFGDQAGMGGTARVSYRSDQSDEPVEVATFTSPGRVLLPRAPRFHSLQIEVALTSNSPSFTPRVRSIYARAGLAGPTSQERAFEAFLDCTDGTSTYHPEDRQVPGAEAAQYLWDLAEQGEVVEFENAFRAKTPDKAETVMVQIENPEQIYLGPGESLIRVRLKELV